MVCVCVYVIHITVTAAHHKSSRQNYYLETLTTCLISAHSLYDFYLAQLCSRSCIATSMAMHKRGMGLATKRLMTLSFPHLL